MKLASIHRTSFLSALAIGMAALLLSCQSPMERPPTEARDVVVRLQITGIGENDSVEKVEIVWNDGDTQIIHIQEINKYYSIKQGVGIFTGYIFRK